MPPLLYRMLESSTCRKTHCIRAASDPNRPEPTLLNDHNVLSLLQSYDAAEYDQLVARYEKLNWRMISKPGGATVKPDDFYSLYG